MNNSKKRNNKQIEESNEDGFEEVQSTKKKDIDLNNIKKTDSKKLKKTNGDVKEGSSKNKQENGKKENGDKKALKKKKVESSDEESSEEEKETKKSKKNDSKSNGKENGKDSKKTKVTKKQESSDEEEEEEEKVVKKDKKKAKTSTETPSKKVKKDEESSASSTVNQSNLATEEETKKFQEENFINVTGNNIKEFRHCPTFEKAKNLFNNDVLATTKGFTKPTPIQAQCWPVVLSGRDIIAIAETGSGKTLAFTLPGLMHIKRALQTEKESTTHNRYPKILVVAPTRELAMQTAEVAEKAGKACGLTSFCVYGGVPKDAQVRTLKGNVDLLVATPGRLLDLFNDGAVNLSEVSYLVLDEADRMLDMGFERDIRAIIKECKPMRTNSNTKNCRQTLMYSATWPTTIQTLAREFLYDPVHVAIGSLDLSANHRVKQLVEVMDPFAKDRKLEELLKKYHGSRKNKIIVFALYKKEASRIEENLQRRGWNCLAIHGDKSQQQRTAALESFKSGEKPLLIATDVAARGLDIPDVEYVINYTFPLTIEDYVHRIGRTGRAGKEGTSYTFFTMHDKAHAGELINVLNEANQEVPENLTQWGTAIKKKEHSMYGNHFKNVDMNTKSSHMKFSIDE